jgi:hypothetical protein
MSKLHIQGIDNQEWNELKWFVRGLIAGIKDTCKDPEGLLEDYWHAWDNTVDLNIWTDGDIIRCTAYSIKPDGYTDTTDFERVDYKQTREVLA